MPTLTTLASGATALGVLFAGWQLVLMLRQARTQFEDQLTEQYRKISADIPLDALLGRPLTDARLEDSLRAFYDYFDLSNEQAFLRNKKRVRASTWVNWREGITQNMARPAFIQAWTSLEPHLGGSFDDLREHLPSSLLYVRSSASERQCKGDRNTESTD